MLKDLTAILALTTFTGWMFPAVSLVTVMEQDPSLVPCVILKQDTVFASLTLGKGNVMFA